MVQFGDILLRDEEFEKLKRNYHHNKELESQRSDRREMEKFKDLIDDTCEMWTDLSETTMELLAFSWHYGKYWESGHPELAGEFEDVPTATILGQIGTTLENTQRALDNCLGHISYQTGRPPQRALRSLFSELVPVWRQQKGTEPTFTHEGSRFEVSAYEVVKAIDPTVAPEVVHNVWRVLRPKIKK